MKFVPKWVLSTGVAIAGAAYWAGDKTTTGVGHVIHFTENKIGLNDDYLSEKHTMLSDFADSGKALGHGKIGTAATSAAATYYDSAVDGGSDIILASVPAAHLTKKQGVNANAAELGKAIEHAWNTGGRDALLSAGKVVDEDPLKAAQAVTRGAKKGTAETLSMPAYLGDLALNGSYRGAGYLTWKAGLSEGGWRYKHSMGATSANFIDHEWGNVLGENDRDYAHRLVTFSLGQNDGEAYRNRENDRKDVGVRTIEYTSNGVTQAAFMMANIDGVAVLTTGAKQYIVASKAAKLAAVAEKTEQLAKVIDKVGELSKPVDQAVKTAVDIGKTAGTTEKALETADKAVQVSVAAKAKTGAKFIANLPLKVMDLPPVRRSFELAMIPMTIKNEEHEYQVKKVDGALKQVGYDDGQIEKMSADEKLAALNKVQDTLKTAGATFDECLLASHHYTAAQLSVLTLEDKASTIKDINKAISEQLESRYKISKNDLDALSLMQKIILDQSLQEKERKITDYLKSHHVQDVDAMSPEEKVKAAKEQVAAEHRVSMADPAVIITSVNVHDQFAYAVPGIIKTQTPENSIVSTASAKRPSVLQT